LKSRGDTHVDRLLREGQAFLAEGRGREASLRFSRVLLGDPRHDAARRGEAYARALLDEEQRRAAVCLEDAYEALGAGDLRAAREGAATALSRGADPDRVQPLLDELDERAGRLAEAAAPSEAAVPERSPRARLAALPRAVFVTGFALVVAGLLGVAVASWDRMLGVLAEAPKPTTTAAPPVASLPAPPPGEVALQEARRLLAQGEAESAVRALDRIPAQDPNYPYARRLRAEAEASVLGGVGR
jgi:hypothetical protein